MISRLSAGLFRPLIGVALCCGCASHDAPSGSAQIPKASEAAPTAHRLPDDPALNAYVRSVRDDLSRGKVGIITDVMHLNSEEAKVFWPIYEDYESELFDLGDQRLELIRHFLAAQQAHMLDDQKAAELADKYFRLEGARLELLKKYHAVIAKDLSPLHAAQFTQIEHRVGTVIDLLIASELPLVQGAGGRSGL